MIRWGVAVFNARQVSLKIRVLRQAATLRDPLFHASPHLSTEILVALCIRSARAEVDCVDRIAVVSEPVNRRGTDAAGVDIDDDLANAELSQVVEALSHLGSELVPV